MLKPYLRKDLDVLFIGLNPAVGSATKGHYFSVNSAFWNQLYAAGLIIQPICKDIADDHVFGSNEINYNGWQFGITDLLPKVVESNSSKVRPSFSHWERLRSEIIFYQPRYAVILHSRVIKSVLRYEFSNRYLGDSFYLGKIIDQCSTEFVNIPFPHGNAITNLEKVKLYKELRKLVEISKGEK